MNSLRSKRIIHSLFRQTFSFCSSKAAHEVYSKIQFPSITQITQTASNSQVLVTNHVDESVFPNSYQLQQIKKNKLEWIYQENNVQTLVNWVGKEKEDNKDDQNVKPLDKQKKLDSLMKAGAKAVRALHSHKITQSDIVFEANLDSDEVSNFLKGFILANYKFKMTEIKQHNATEEELKSLFLPISKLNILSKNKEVQLSSQQFQYLQKAAYYTLYARQLGNLRGDIANTEFLLQEAKEIQLAHPEKVVLQFLKGDQLVEQGLNLAHAVGKGSKNPPIVVNLTYLGNPLNSKQVDVALIGKGVCFDAGGLNIKSTGFMETMYMDKSGAVATLSSFRAAVELGLRVNLTATVGLVENFLSSTSYRPSDIIRSHKGLTVEIGNTDAEGRLVLADCMSWTQQLHKPKTMIELSTLTGACSIALGEEQAGLFTNSETLCQDLQEASKISGDLLWRLPITDEHRDSMKGTYSDLKNSGKTRYGGASTAAAFLENFVEKGVDWAHVDIAGPAMSNSDKGHLTSGVTGFGVQLLLQYLSKIHNQQKQ